MSKLKEKYGLITAIAMVVGIVIGSGVFFKAEKILVATGGNLTIGILAWVLGAIIMLICAYAFSIVASKLSYINGLVDYAEAAAGKKYGYYVAWFSAVIYYPSMTGVLAWLTSRYLCTLIGWDITGAQCMLLSMFILIISYTVNALSPIIAGKVQVSTTVIKMIPLSLMAVFGTIFGLSNGMTMQNFTTVVTEIDTGTALFTAVVATAFAYEGWIITTSINAELKNSKRNLPIALVVGTIIVAAVYVSYYIGLAGAIPNEVIMSSGELGPKMAFEAVFGNIGATLLFVFIVISCYGTLNGLMLACVRGFFALGVRNSGPNPKLLSQLDEVTNIPTNAGVLGLLFAAIWLVYFYGANLTTPWFGAFSFDSSELPIITIYAIYIPIFVWLLKDKTLGVFKGKIIPVLAILSCLFMVVAAVISHGEACIYYLVLFAIVMLIGTIFDKK